MVTTTFPTSYLQISGVSVDFSRSGKNVESAELRLDGERKSIGRSARTVRILRKTFDPPMKLSHGSSFSLWLTYKKKQRILLAKNEPEEIDIDMKDVFLNYGKHEYRKSLNEITIVISLVWDKSIEQVGQSATSGAEGLDDMYKICPRFRILVIGKTGVGKSSLINNASGTQNALVSDDTSGGANIDAEFISLLNDKFVLHDSEGFEPAEEENVKVVQEFIKRRRDMKDLKDRLHAVWLCCEVPCAGGRLLEKGTEGILQLKKDGVLGNLPVIVVFTKYDRLIDRVDRTLDDKGLSDDEIKERVIHKADAELQEMCTKPFKRFAGSEIPYATVSKNEMHKGMIAELIQTTEEYIRQHLQARCP